MEDGMATLKSGTTPGSRIDTGDHLLEVVSSLGAKRTKPVAERIAAFKAAHEAYKKADDVVGACDAKLRAAQAIVGERDVTQDAAVDELASSLAGDGFPRVNPFKPFHVGAPTAVKKMGYEAEAKVVLDLAAKVKKHKNAGPKSKAAAAECEKAAKAVLAALSPIPKLTQARTAAISRRDALEQPLETAFAALKRGARSAEDDGATGLFDALFGVAKPGSGKRAKKGAAKATKGADVKGKKKGSGEPAKNESDSGAKPA